MTRRVVVTGSASGIGRATASLLATQGCEVVGVDLKDAAICADLATDEGRAAVIAAVSAADAVIACAGVTGANPAVPSVNFFGVVDVLEGLRPVLARSANPRVAVISSVSSVHPVDEQIVEACLRREEQTVRERAAAVLAEGHAPLLYSSSKAALARWVRRTAITPDWAGAGIALNAVAPGVVLTPMTDALVHDPRMREVMDRAVPMTLNGYASPEAVAAPLAFLASPENTHITGQVLFVDGGAEATLRGDVVW